MNEDYMLLIWTAPDAAEVTADYALAEGHWRFEKADEAEAEGERLLDEGKATYYEVWLENVGFMDREYVDLVASGGA